MIVSTILVVGLLVLAILALFKLIRIEDRMDETARQQERVYRSLDRLSDEVRNLAGTTRAPGTGPAAAPTPEPPTAQAPAPAPVPAPKPGAPQPRVAVPPPLPVAAQVPAAAPREVRAPAPHPAKPTWAEYDAAEAEPPRPSRLAESAREILRKIWSWILVGEEYRIQGVTMEYAVATTWLLRLGIVAIVACVVYFLKWSIDQGFVSDAVRVGIGIMTGVGMLVAGRLLLKGKYRLLGTGLMGGGVAALYASVYAGVEMFEIIPVAVGFGLAVLVTVAAGLLAVRTESLLLAILGIVGGYCSPVALRTEAPNLPLFYSYLLLLGLGILGIARYRNWRLLNYLSFFFTYALFGLSLGEGYDTADFPVAMTFLSVFFLLQSSLVCLHNIWSGSKATTLEIVHVLLNAGVFTAFGYGLIHDAHGRPYPAILSLALAVFYIGQVTLFLRLKRVDRGLLVSLMGLAGFYTAWTMPLILEKETLTLSWALQAFVFLWLADRLDSSFLRHLAHALYAMVFIRMAVLDLGNNFDAHPLRAASMSLYWKAMAGRLWNFGVCIGSLFAAFFLQRRARRAGGRFGIGAANDVRVLENRAASAGAFYWCALLFAFVFLHFELNTMFVYAEPLRLPVLTLLWCGMAAYFLWQCARPGGAGFAARLALAVFAVGAVLKLFLVDAAAWDLGPRLLFDAPFAWFDAGMRLLDFGVVLAMLAAGWLAFSRDAGRSGPTAAVFGYAGLALLFAYASLETNTCLHWRLPGFRAAGISILWALFAIGFIAGGIWRNVRTLRYLGLLLFAIVAGKVFLVDLEHLKVIYRVVAFFVVGVFLLLGAFAYMRAGGKFAAGKEEEEGTANGRE